MMRPKYFNLALFSLSSSHQWKNMLCRSVPIWNNEKQEAIIFTIPQTPMICSRIHSRRIWFWKSVFYSFELTNKTEILIVLPLSIWINFISDGYQNASFLVFRKIFIPLISSCCHFSVSRLIVLIRESNGQRNVCRSQWHLLLFS